MAGNILNVKASGVNITSSSNAILQGYDSSAQIGFWVNSIALEGYSNAGGLDPVIKVNFAIIPAGSTAWSVGTAITPAKVNRLNPATIKTTWLETPATAGTTPTDLGFEVAFQPQLSRVKEFPHSDRGIYVNAGDILLVMVSATANATASFVVQIDE